MRIASSPFFPPNLLRFNGAEFGSLGAVPSLAFQKSSYLGVVCNLGETYQLRASAFHDRLHKPVKQSSDLACKSRAVLNEKKIEG